MIESLISIFSRFDSCAEIKLARVPVVTNSLSVTTSESADPGAIDEEGEGEFGWANVGHSPAATSTADKARQREGIFLLMVLRVRSRFSYGNYGKFKPLKKEGGTFGHA